MPVDGRRLEQLLRRVDDAASRGAALVQLERARLLEHVDHRRWSRCPTHSGLPASASARSGPTRSPRSRSVVGHAQIRTWCDPSSVDVVLVDVDRMDGGQVRAEDALALQQLRRRAALDRQALLDLSRLLGEVDVQRRLAPRAHAATTVASRRGRPRARCGWRHRCAPRRPPRSSSTRAAQRSASPSENDRCTPSSGLPSRPPRR